MREAHRLSSGATSPALAELNGLGSFLQSPPTTLPELDSSRLFHSSRCPRGPRCSKRVRCWPRADSSEQGNSTGTVAWGSAATQLGPSLPCHWPTSGARGGREGVSSPSAQPSQLPPQERGGRKRSQVTPSLRPPPADTLSPCKEETKRFGSDQMQEDLSKNKLTPHHPAPRGGASRLAARTPTAHSRVPGFHSGLQLLTPASC